MKLELMEGDCLEFSAHTPMYNPHILPLEPISVYRDISGTSLPFIINLYYSAININM